MKKNVQNLKLPEKIAKTKKKRKRRSIADWNNKNFLKKELR